MFRDFPLPMHRHAQGAAEAAQCANAQGRFWDYHDVLFKNQQALAPDKLKEYAAGLGLDMSAFNACVDSHEFRSAVEQDHQEGQQFGVSGTPAFFINGRFLSGAQPFQGFAGVIDEELQSASGNR